MIAMKAAPPVGNQDVRTRLLDDRSQRFCHFLAGGEVAVGVRHHPVLRPQGSRSGGRLSKLLVSVGGPVHLRMARLARREVQKKHLLPRFHVKTGQMARREVHVANMRSHQQQAAAHIEPRGGAKPDRSAS